jgi:uncharacterized protein (TIGR04255 family)
MMISDAERCTYARPQLLEVICQLRFPTILSIGANEPVEFQEEVRADFPKYSAVTERQAPKVVGANTANPQLEQPKPIINYNFISLDGRWKLNLTSGFISLSTTAYTGWEEFAAKLDRPLAAFIERYKPAAFERIGLRYVNAFSRKALDLEGTPWSELIQPAYLSVLAEEDVQEEKTNKCATDLEMALTNGCRLKLHAGPGLVRRGGKVADQEVRFILDQDLSMTGDLSMQLAVGGLNTLHNQAQGVFRGAITEKLHQAMEPM